MSDYVETCAHCRGPAEYSCEACCSPICDDCRAGVYLSEIEGETPTSFCGGSCLCRITLQIDALPRGNSADNVHWRTKEKWRADWTVLVKQALSRKTKPAKPLKLARLICTRYSSAPRIDFENLVQGFKVPTDRLVAEGILADDNMGVIVERHYDSKPGPRGGGHITITIQELDREEEFDAVG